jgi:hypothetical protein
MCVHLFYWSVQQKTTAFREASNAIEREATFIRPVSLSSRAVLFFDLLLDRPFCFFRNTRQIRIKIYAKGINTGTNTKPTPAALSFVRFLQHPSSFSNQYKNHVAHGSEI